MTLIDRFTTALHEAVAERGADFTYTVPPNSTDGECCYADENGAPSCGIGLAAEKFDHEFFVKIREHEANHGTFGASTIASAYYGGNVPKLPGLVKLGDDQLSAFKSALDAFQQTQDRGYPWGAAQAAYDGVLDGTFLSVMEAEKWVRANYKSQVVSRQWLLDHPERDPDNEFEDDYF